MSEVEELKREIDNLKQQIEKTRKELWDVIERVHDEKEVAERKLKLCEERVERFIVELRKAREVVSETETRYEFASKKLGDLKARVSRAADVLREVECS